MDLGKNVEIGIGSKTARQGAKRVRAALDSIKRKSRETARASARDSKKMAGGFKLITGAAIALAATMAGRNLVGTIKNFGQAVSDLSAITGAVGKDLDFLRQKSKEFGETTTLSASQAAEAFKVIASAKPDLLENVEALSLVTQEAIALAEATGEDLPTAANTLGAALNQFGAGADQASRFINVMAAGSKRGAALVGEMAEALKQSGVIAAQAGLSFEETNAALQVLSTFAIKGSRAGNQFRGTLLALAAAGEDRFNPEVVTMTVALDNLAAANLTTAERVKIFGRENLASANILINQREQLSKLTEQLTGTNIAYEQQAIRVDNLAGDTLALKSAYEGLELTIGQELNGTLRGLTQAATENIRALAANPLLKSGTRKILDLFSTAVQDVSNVFKSLKETVLDAGGGAAVFERIWGDAIDNIVSATKFLWEQFVVGGPANLKLAFTLMIAAFDRFRIGATKIIENVKTTTIAILELFAVEGIKQFELAKLGMQLAFTTLAQNIGRIFDQLKINIGTAIDAIINLVANKIEGVGNTLAALGFDKRAEEIKNISTSIKGLATFEEAATKSANENAEARRKQISELDALIIKTQEKAQADKDQIVALAKEQLLAHADVAEAARNASIVAVQGAIEERDATIEAIKALREKRKEIVDGGAAVPPPPTETLAAVADEAVSAYEKLGDTQKLVLDGMSDGIADMVAQGKIDFKSLANSIIQDLIRIAIKAQLLNLFTSIFSGGLGGGVPIATGGVGAGSASFVPPTTTLNAQHGLNFKVGGSGGTDSEVVAFNATPGEEVSVKTRKQQMSGGGIVVKQTNIIDARGADAERIEARLPVLLEENRQRILGDVQRMRSRGELRL